MNRFQQQCAWEEEGGAAGLDGKTRNDCPYSQATQRVAWNFWVFGCENARHEMENLKQGFVTFSSTASNAVPFQVPIQQAIEHGMWKPRYVTITKKSS